MSPDRWRALAGGGTSHARAHRIAPAVRDRCNVPQPPYLCPACHVELKANPDTSWPVWCSYRCRAAASNGPAVLTLAGEFAVLPHRLVAARHGVHTPPCLL